MVAANPLLVHRQRPRSREGVVLDGFDASPAGREYSLASYLLISTGNDGIGLPSMTPENWWPAYGIDLGAALGPRYEWEGLLRRDFTGGISLVEEPDVASRTILLPSPMLTTAGTLVSSVTLNASEGAVLRYPAGSVVASISQAPVLAADPAGRHRRAGSPARERGRAARSWEAQGSSRGSGPSGSLWPCQDHGAALCETSLAFRSGPGRSARPGRPLQRSHPRSTRRQLPHSSALHLHWARCPCELAPGRVQSAPMNRVPRALGARKAVHESSRDRRQSIERKHRLRCQTRSREIFPASSFSQFA